MAHPSSTTMTPASPALTSLNTCKCGHPARPGYVTCQTCEGKRLQASTPAFEVMPLTEDVEVTTVKVCKVVGFAEKHFAATMRRLHPSVASQIPDAALAAMRAGKRPPRGFGLVGTSGAGKTMAVAAMVRLCLRKWLLANVNSLGRLVLSNPPIMWVDWPVRVEWMRENYDKASSFMAQATTTPLLVIDDIGAERVVGDTYERDYGAAKLDLLIHGRENKMLPTIWTSNLNEEALNARYGGRVVSRLNGCNPASSWIVAPDQRAT